MKQISLCVLCAGALLWAACTPAPMTTAGYSKTCTAKEDCAAVYVGPVCGCGCDGDAIAKTEIDRYQKEYSARQKGCGQLPLCAPCPTTRYECKAGVCAILSGN
ncbi:hypothetical protein L6R29_01070 [Myxococcota bacterium]|nr:hypothetical protein [Myxococcota bacterium]